MSHVACHPAATCATGHADFRAALFDPRHATPLDWCTSDGSDPAPRLAVHRNNVVGSLVDALADNFPVTERLTGSEFFRAMAAVFVRSHPPQSPILAHYGAEFPAFIANFGPASGLPYLADLARLEFAWVTAYHAADASALDATALGRALSTPEALHELRFAWHPSLQVLGSPYAVVSLWAAHQNEEDFAGLVIDHTEQAIVLRDALEVVVLPVAPGAACFAHLSLNHAPFGEAVAQAFAVDTSFDPGATLALLVSHHALTALHAHDSHATTLENSP